MWTESTPPEAERHLVQRGVAPSAMAMTAIVRPASIIHAPPAPPGDVRGPGFATLVAGTVVAAGGARSCPTSRRSLGRLGVGAGPDGIRWRAVPGAGDA
jgi:hypothetical protein